MANRTPSGEPTAAARKKYGDKNGAFPVFDTASAEAALKLRGHHGDPKKVIDKVARFANKSGDQSLKGKVADARDMERHKK